MSDNTEQVVIPTAPELPPVSLTMSREEIFKVVETYKNNADASLGKIQQNIDKLTEQLNNLQKMRLMVLGQRELVIDLFNKMTGQETQETK